jgi:hypothetical protein
MEEYLPIATVASRLGLTPKTVRNKMAKGDFKLGVHYFRPAGMETRFKWSAIVQWMEQSQKQADTDNVIPMPAHYRDRESFKNNGHAS